MVAVQAKTPGGGAGTAGEHLRVIDDASGKTLTEPAGAMIQPPAPSRWTAGTLTRRCLAPVTRTSRTYSPRLGPRASCSLCVHILISNFRRSQLDVFRDVGAARLPSYLNRFCRRHTRPDQRVDLFRCIPDRCVQYSLPATYSELITV